MSTIKTYPGDGIKEVRLLPEIVYQQRLTDDGRPAGVRAIGAELTVQFTNLDEKVEMRKVYCTRERGIQAAIEIGAATEIAA